MGLVLVAVGAATIALVLGGGVPMMRAERELFALGGLACATRGAFDILRAMRRTVLVGAIVSAALAGLSIAAYFVPAAVQTRNHAHEEALGYAVNGNDIERVDQLLEQGADPNSALSPRLTPLVIASSQGYTPIAERLLAAGADPNLPTKSGMTPLVAAVSQDHIDVARLLLKAGARPNDRTSYGTAIELAADRPRMRALLLAHAD